MSGITGSAYGRVSFPPEQRHTANGKAMLSFSMRVEQSFVATESRPPPDSIYLRVVAWDTEAERLPYPGVPAQAARLRGL